MRPLVVCTCNSARSMHVLSECFFTPWPYSGVTAYIAPQGTMMAQLYKGLTRSGKSQAPDLAKLGAGAFHGLKVRVCVCWPVYLCMHVCVCVCDCRLRYKR